MEARANPIPETTSQLLLLHKCKSPNCPNNAAHCLALGGANDRHFMLTAHSIRIWSTAVNDGIATLHNPLITLLNSIMNVWKARNSMPQPVPPPPTPYQLPPLPSPYYAPYPFPMAPPYSQAGPYGKGVEPSDRAKELQSESRPSSSGSIVALRSS